MSVRIEVEQVFKIDLEKFIEVGLGLGYDEADIKYALYDCEIARDDDAISVINREYIGKVGPFAHADSRAIIRAILNIIFDSYPKMDRLFILDN